MNHFAQLCRRPTIFRRVIGTSMIVLTLATLTLAGAERYQNENDLYARNARTVPAQLAYIGEELREDNIDIGSGELVKDERFQAGANLFAVCRSGNQIYQSSGLINHGVGDLCPLLPDSVEQIATQPVILGDGNPYYLYPLEFDTDRGHFVLLILRDGTEAAHELKVLDRRLALKVGITLPILLLLLISAALWGMKPLKMLGQQLREIIKGRRERLDAPQAHELHEITLALNEMLAQSERRKSTYENAMKDLAHSLKTRLAAAQAILDEQSDPAKRSKELYEQLGQMDLLVQYQLRKAVMGRQGLSQRSADIEPVVKQLANMLSKVYRDKGIHCHIDIDAQCRFPGSKEDLMELMGNLMDNAHRFAINQVRVSARLTERGHCQLQVEDDGPGIDPEQRQRVLRRGERADERHPGQGIGLAVCHELALAYGGELTIDNSPLQGARITLTLPLESFSTSE
ncbi:ATP-binding protein [Ferrimonas balearica]|uniref:ATP-binding protein n=1 Tax=Ferrimonas balearica TaxID=44012 RepID=UPI001C9A1225|nr:ATP-binding protein [Ferrimonas balearica]MBY5991829.1 hypothetical protein [Ferrimonas balearica]